ncbi:hypothetical protein GQX74_002691 [Glossina fuscipes]|nr:hypothetical protein GQX74_002691 [Glossina fuscipes]
MENREEQLSGEICASGEAAKHPNLSSNQKLQLTTNPLLLTCSAPTDRYVGNSEYDHLYRQYVGIESTRNPEFINGWFSNSFNKSSMAAMMNAATNKVLHINVHELLIENRSLREKLKEVITDRDRLLCEVSNLRLELDMAELKRLPEESPVLYMWTISWILKIFDLCIYYDCQCNIHSQGRDEDNVNNSVQRENLPVKLFGVRSKMFRAYDVARNSEQFKEFKDLVALF